MKKILLTTTALIVVGIAPAAAADLAARPYTKAPAAAIAIDDWTGFSLGAMGGYAQENSSGIGTLERRLAGGTVGYNWQAGQTSCSALKPMPRGLTSVQPWVFPEVWPRSTAKIRDMGTVRGRIGYAFEFRPDLRHRRLRLGRRPHHRHRCSARTHFGQPSPLRLDRRRRRRGHVRTEVVGQGRIPLSQPSGRDLLRRHRTSPA